MSSSSETHELVIVKLLFIFYNSGPLRAVPFVARLVSFIFCLIEILIEHCGLIFSLPALGEGSLCFIFIEKCALCPHPLRGEVVPHQLEIDFFTSLRRTILLRVGKKNRNIQTAPFCIIPEQKITKKPI